MKISFEPDFIYLVSGFEATLILHNCTNCCKFCPAAKLQNFQNYGKLNSIFDFSCKKLTIYGNINCSYIETFLLKLRSFNPTVQVHLVGCDCNMSQKIELDYSHIIYPDLDEYMKILPKEFILPAVGDSLTLRAFAVRYLVRYPRIKIKVMALDSSNQDVEFWSESKIQDFQKQIDNETL